MQNFDHERLNSEKRLVTELDFPKNSHLGEHHFQQIDRISLADDKLEDEKSHTEYSDPANQKSLKKQSPTK